MRRSTVIGLVVIPLGFFLWGFFTLSDYGVNTDEPFHFMRGQAYLHYYLTGSTTYDSLEGFTEHIQANASKTASDESVAATASSEVVSSEKRFSAYQQPTHTAEALIVNDVGHPPLNGILAAATNKLFYQQLGWLGDIESYHLFEIAIATLGIALVAWWAYLEFGFVAALMAGIALALHPMYLGESRFNIKDPIETVFFAATLFAVWRAITLGRDRKAEDSVLKWLLLGGIAFGAALATKFNALFVLPIVALWCVSMFGAAGLRLGRKYEGEGIKGSSQTLTTKYFLLSTWRQWFNVSTAWGYPLALLAAALVVYASWPNLWGQALDHLTKVYAFYFQLGTSEQYATQFITNGGWNLYPVLDVILRAPLVTLFLAAVGVAGLVRFRRTPQLATLLLWAIWLVIPILRVTLPGQALYGATRQIMEYLPALALFTGVGASILVESIQRWLKQFRTKGGNYQLSIINYQFVPARIPVLITTLIALLYLPIVVTLTRYHPNPQLFYNSLIGGFKGAYAMDFPGWNNTMNNAYVAGIDWLNANAAPNAKLSAVFALRSSLPPHRLRSDIELSNVHFSGPLEEGEYIMEILPIPDTSFIPKYVNRFLDPVYVDEVDGVPLLRIWQNDGQHRRQNLTLASEPIASTEIKSDGQSLILDFGASHRFHRLELIPAEIGTPIGEAKTPCVALTEGALSISADGTTWQRLENVPYVGVNRLAYQTHTFPDYLLAGDHLQFVNIGPNANACLLQPVAVRGWIYDEQG